VSRRVIALLVTLVVLAGVLVIGDRVAAAFAESQTSKSLVVHAPFDERPKVTVHGFPFLTQAIEGKYDDVEVSGGGLQLGDIHGASLDAHLRGVHLALSDVFHQNVHQLDVDSVDGDVTLPYSELARLANVQGLTLADDQGAIKVTLSSSIPLLGTVQLTGSAHVTVSGSSLRLQILKLSALGVSIPQAVLSQLSSAIQVPITIPALPYGLRISSVGAADHGVVVHGAGTQVVLQANAQ
jgi:hypothetical protein